MYEAVKFSSNYCFSICKMTVETMKKHSDILVNRTEQIAEFGGFFEEGKCYEDGLCHSPTKILFLKVLA